MRGVFIIAPCVVAAGLCATSGARAQGDGAERRCVGEMVFVNPDASSRTYAMELVLGAQGYAITSRNVTTGETTVDRGDCVAYWTGRCRHDLAADGTPVDDCHDFELRPVLNGDFACTETWKDGSVGRTVLTCDARMSPRAGKGDP